MGHGRIETIAKVIAFIRKEKASALNRGSDDIVAAPHVAKGRRPEVECGERCR